MSHWGYTRENGPDRWWVHAPAANGRYQSPVDIVSSQCVPDDELRRTPLVVHYDPAASKVLKNTGHGVQIGTDGKDGGYSRCYIEGGPYRHRYQLEQFHFHWGPNNHHGSEHLLDGKSYAAEAHLVHWNTELFPSLGEAAKSACGLAVLGVFIKVGKEHPALNKLTKLFPKITHAEDQIPINGGFDPSLILPDNRSRYYTYVGSLTTPPCYESIQFLIFHDPIEVSEAQMNMFRQLYSIKRDEAPPSDEFGGKMLANFRPPQPLNDRNILKSF